MVRTLIVRGMIAGLVAGAVAFGIAKVVGEPQVDKAIAFEEYVAAHGDGASGAHHDDEEPLVTRSQQNFAGLGTGTLIYGAALGGVFGLVFAIAYGRLGTMTVRGTAAVLGLLGFVSVFLVPFTKYPSVPPAIGDPDTIDRRTSLFLGLIVVSIAGMVAAVMFRRWLVLRLGEWNATVVAGLAYVLLVVVCYVALPGVNEVPQALLRDVVPANGDAGITFPPSVLWRFRVSSVAVQLGLWSTLALGFGMIAQRSLHGSHADLLDQPASA